jgi:hypothetical protein
MNNYIEAMKLMVKSATIQPIHLFFYAACILAIYIASDAKDVNTLRGMVVVIGILLLMRLPFPIIAKEKK